MAVAFDANEDVEENKTEAPTPTTRTPLTIVGIDAEDCSPLEGGARYETVLFCLTLASLHVGSRNIGDFPVNVTKYGGLWYVGANLVFLVLIGWPLSFFECLIGQLTQRGLTKAFNAYGSAFQGIGIGMTVTTFLIIFLNNSSIGHFANSINSGMKSTEIIDCGNEWNTPACASLHMNQQCPNTLVYSNGSCVQQISIDYKQIDAALEHYKYTWQKVGEFDVSEFSVMLTCWLIIVFASLFGVVPVMAIMSATAVIKVTMFHILVVHGLSKGTSLAGFEYIWRISRIRNLLSAEGLSTLCTSMLDSISFGCSFLPAIGALRKPRDDCFYPTLVAVLLDFVCALLGLLLFCSLIGQGLANSPDSSYMFATDAVGDYVRGFIPQMLGSAAYGGMGWVVFYNFFQIFLVIPYCLCPIFFLLAFLRDHPLRLFRSERHNRWIVSAGFFLVVLVVTGVTCSSSGRKLVHLLNVVSIYEVTSRPLFYCAIVVIVYVYGETELRIDLGRIYREPDGWKRHFSPTGDVMFGAWAYWAAASLVMSEIVCLLQNVHIARGYSALYNLILWSLPIGGLLLVPIYGGCAYWVQSRKKTKAVLIFYPNEDHPSYNRIMADYQRFDYKHCEKEIEMEQSNDVWSEEVSEKDEMVQKIRKGEFIPASEAAD